MHKLVCSNYFQKVTHRLSIYLKVDAIPKLQNWSILRIGTSYLPQFQKRAVTNLKNHSTKNNEKFAKT